MTEEQKIAKDLDKNIKYLKDMLGFGESFDVIFREYLIGRRRAASFSINAMTNDLLVSNVLEDMTLLKQEELNINTLKKVFYSHTTHLQAKLLDNFPDAVTSMLSGEVIFFIDGEDRILAVDARSFPVRAPSESNIEKVTRGSRDSFVETIAYNAVLIRRRLRDPNLRFVVTKVGTRSRTDVAICYLKDITNPRLVDKVKDALEKIDTDGVPMAEKAVEEYIVPGNRWNPLPRVRFTERPDVAATHLLEGHVCVIVDTSPNVMILPSTLWHHVQHAEEYRQNVLTGTFLRLIRLSGVAFSLLLPPIWLTAVLQPHLLPETLSFLGPRESGIIPLGLQFIVAEIGLELVRMATVHVPSAQSTALGFIGSFMLGDYATKVGLFSNETIFYMAVAVVGTFATPSVELALSLRIFRMGLVVLATLFKLPGLLVGLVALLILLLRTKSFDVPYLWPLIPLNFKALLDVIFRLPIPNKVLRPAALKPIDQNRLDNESPADKKSIDKKDKDK